VFVVDDHPIIREGLRGIIDREQDLVVCGEAEHATKVVSAIKACAPDVIILDLSLGQRSGLEVLKDLSIHCPRIPVLVLSMHDESLYANRALRAGARGYLMKEEGSERLLTAIRRLLAGHVFVSENVMTKIVSSMRKSNEESQSIDRLSDRELQVFELMGQGVNTASIAAQLNVSPKTVQGYIVRAKEKFGVERAHDLLRAAIRWHEESTRTSR
jgi:DNA-binding NarL/FixJ family response regulator